MFLEFNVNDVIISVTILECNVTCSFIIPQVIIIDVNTLDI